MGTGGRGAGAGPMGTGGRGAGAGPVGIGGGGGAGAGSMGRGGTGAGPMGHGGAGILLEKMALHLSESQSDCFIESWSKPDNGQR